MSGWMPITRAKFPSRFRPGSLRPRWLRANISELSNSVGRALKSRLCGAAGVRLGAIATRVALLWRKGESRRYAGFRADPAQYGTDPALFQRRSGPTTRAVSAVRTVVPDPFGRAGRRGHAAGFGTDLQHHP